MHHLLQAASAPITISNDVDFGVMLSKYADRCLCWHLGVCIGAQLQQISSGHPTTAGSPAIWLCFFT